LTIATILLNEESLVEPMLRGARMVADQIVCGIDSRTTDRSEEIARDYGAETFRFEWDDDFAAARNLTLERATSDWTMVVDADERLTDAGIAVVGDVLSKADGWNGFSFMTAEIDAGGVFQHANKTSVRLFENRPDLRYRGVVHEEVWLDDGAWCHVEGVYVLAHLGYCEEIYVGRQKHKRNLRLLRKRLDLDPGDVYAAEKLMQELSIDSSGRIV
jgi:glycosyltransferase involved in cell wall biosynthesis